MGQGNSRGESGRHDGRARSREGTRDGATGRPLGAASTRRARVYRGTVDPDDEVWEAELVDEPWDPAEARSAEDVEIIDAIRLDAIAEQLRTADEAPGGAASSATPPSAFPVGGADRPDAGFLETRVAQTGPIQVPRPRATTVGSPLAGSGPSPAPASDLGRITTATSVSADEPGTGRRRRHRPQPAWQIGLVRLSSQVAGSVGLKRLLPAGGARGRRIGRVPRAAVIGALVVGLVLLALVIVLLGHHSGSGGDAVGRGSGGRDAGNTAAPSGAGLAGGTDDLGGDLRVGSGGQSAEQAAGIQAKPAGIADAGVDAPPPGAGPDAPLAGTAPSADGSGQPPSAGGSGGGSAGGSSAGPTRVAPSAAAATPNGPRCYQGGPVTGLLLGVLGAPTC
jgi:hypothetical protein